MTDLFKTQQEVKTKVKIFREGLEAIVSKHADQYLNRESPLIPAIRALHSFESDFQQDLGPYNVGVVGVVSDGKSTFINNIIGHDVLPCGVGATTTFPIEISSSFTNQFKLSIHYKSRHQLRDEFDYMAVGYKRGFGDIKYKEIVRSLNYLFDFGVSRKNPNPKDEEPTLIKRESASPELPALIDLVGSAVTTECFDTSAALSAALERLLADRLIHVLDHVSISGPFPNIPSGVVLVDTPGLGDRTFANSIRTSKYVARLDEVWFVCSSAGLDHKATEDFFTKADHVDKIPVHIIVSKSWKILQDTTGKSRDKTLKSFRSTLRDFYRAIHLGVLWDDLQPEEGQVSPEQANIIKTRVDAISIDFTECPEGGSPLGLETWIARLRDCGESRSTALTQVQTEVAAIEGRLQNLANVVYPDAGAVRAWTEAALHLTDFSSQSVVVNVQDFYMRVATRGLWSLLHFNTKKALMDPVRGGYFISEGAIRTIINVNLDIAVEWSTCTTPVLNGPLRELYSQLMSIPDPSNEHRRHLNQIMCDLVETCFTRDSTVWITRYLRELGVYQWGRNSMPTANEVMNVVSALFGEINHRLAFLRSAVSAASATLLRRDSTDHSAIQEPVRAVLRLVATGAPGPAPEPAATVLDDAACIEWWNVMWAEVCAAMNLVIDEEIEAA